MNDDVRAGLAEPVDTGIGLPASVPGHDPEVWVTETGTDVGPLPEADSAA